MVLNLNGSSLLRHVGKRFAEFNWTERLQLLKSSATTKNNNNQKKQINYVLLEMGPCICWVNYIFQFSIVIQR